MSAASIMARVYLMCLSSAGIGYWLAGLPQKHQIPMAVFVAVVIPLAVVVSVVKDKA